MVEAIVDQTSRYVSRPIRDLDLAAPYGIHLIAVHRTNASFEAIGDDFQLQFGDVLLVEGTPAQIKRFCDNGDLFAITEGKAHTNRRVGARAAIDQAREEHAFLRGDPSPIVAGSDGLTWWNYAGGKANILLAQLLEHALGGKVTARDASLTCKGEASRSEAGLRSVLRSLHEEGRPSGQDARVHAQGAARSRVSKFEPCLPETLLCDLLAARVVDVDGARAALAAFTSEPNVASPR